MAITSKGADALWPANLPTYTTGDGLKYGVGIGSLVGGVGALHTLTSKSSGPSLAARLPKASTRFAGLLAGTAIASTGQAAAYEWLRTDRRMGENAANVTSSGLVTGLAGAGLLASKGRLAPGFARTGLWGVAVSGALMLGTTAFSTTLTGPAIPSESARNKYGH